MSWLGKLFAFSIKRSVENDEKLQELVYNADIRSEIARKRILERCNGDVEEVKKAIPEDVRKYLGFDF